MGKMPGKKNHKMLYDHGKPEDFGPDSWLGDAGVRKYPGVNCDMKSFPNRVVKDYNTVCFGKSPAEFEKAYHRKPNGSTHNS